MSSWWAIIEKLDKMWRMTDDSRNVLVTKEGSVINNESNLTSQTQLDQTVHSSSFDWLYHHTQAIKWLINISHELRDIDLVIGISFTDQDAGLIANQSINLSTTRTDNATVYQLVCGTHLLIYIKQSNIAVHHIQGHKILTYNQTSNHKIQSATNHVHGSGFDPIFAQTIGRTVQTKTKVQSDKTIDNITWCEWSKRWRNWSKDWFHPAS